MQKIPLRTQLAILGTAGALVLAGCAAPATSGGDEPNADPVVDAEPADDGTADAVTGVPAQLQFQAVTLTGEQFDGASILGTPTLLWFWSEWCPICNAEAPSILDALDEIPANVQVLGVPGRSSQAGIERFVEQNGLEVMVQIVDTDGSIWSNFSVASQPTLAIIDAEGNVQIIPGSVGKSGLIQAAESIA